MNWKELTSSVACLFSAKLEFWACTLGIEMVFRLLQQIFISHRSLVWKSFQYWFSVRAAGNSELRVARRDHPNKNIPGVLEMCKRSACVCVCVCKFAGVTCLSVRDTHGVELKQKQCGKEVWGAAELCIVWLNCYLVLKPGLWKMQMCGISVNFATEEGWCNVQGMLEINISPCRVKIIPSQFIKIDFSTYCSEGLLPSLL